jgi:hypothetical protein
VTRYSNLYHRHPEVRALARLEGWPQALWPAILRGSLRSHLRMTEPVGKPAHVEIVDYHG